MSEQNNIRYLVNRETKEHRIAPSVRTGGFSEHWHVVEADPEGWIKHDAKTENDLCPLPDGTKCHVRMHDGSTNMRDKAETFDWGLYSHSPEFRIVAYRPILDDKSGTLDDAFDEIERYLDSGCRADGKDNIINRLRTAHKAASELPDIIAELREVLEPMGLGVIYLTELETSR